MKKIIIFLFAFIIALSPILPVYAADGKVTYSGNAGNFVFEPGSENSLTDLFDNFKDVMPGDTLTQKITVKNNADNKIKVKIYLRSLGAREDSVEFLSQLNLKVAKSEENKMAYMFDAAANESAQLTDWVCLGTLYSGGEVILDVSLNVPKELSNEFQNNIGYLDWEFMVTELPVDQSDPKPPQMGDNSNIILWIAIMLISIFLIIILFIWHKKEKKNKKSTSVR